MTMTMTVKPVFYWTDALFYLIIIILFYVAFRLSKSEHLRQKFYFVFSKPRYWVALVILAWFGLVGFLDSLHYRAAPNYYQTQSVLDWLLSPRNSQFEITYSAPFALRAYDKEVTQKSTGSVLEVYPRLQYAGIGISSEQEKWLDIAGKILKGIIFAIVITGILYLGLKPILKKIVPPKPWISFWITLFTVIFVTSALFALMFDYHVLGTNKVGQDVLYISLKSIRTGLIIGSVTTIVMFPFALVLGMWAGYFRGWVDDIIQYIYTTLSSVPGVLLIAAAVLALQAKIEQEPELRLLTLCIILGVTTWTGLCRLLRGETMKLREAEYVQAAMGLGVKQFNILFRHIMPNLMHIVIITLVLDFSGLVLAEAVLSFIGVGVDPATFSFGNMINAGRLEMARDPIVWWTLCGAFVLMFLLVFSANIVSEAIQDALNPRNV